MNDLFADFGSAVGAAATQEQQEINKIEKETGNGFNWDSLFNLVGTGIENSDKLAGVFSDKYRDDQIRLAQQRNQASFFGGINQGSTQSNSSKFILIGIVALVLIIVIALIMKKK